MGELAVLRARIRELEQEQESIVQRSRDYALLEEKVSQLEQEREWARVALGAGIVERDKAQAQLQAMTEDRDLWKEAHDDDCPNKNMLETTEVQLQEVTRALGEDLRISRIEADHARESFRLALKEVEIVNSRLQEFTQENDKLRGLLAKGKGDCIFCGLPAEDISKCASGFPGCARMDDIINAPVVEAESQLAQLQSHNRILADALEDFVSITEGSGDVKLKAIAALKEGKK